MALKPRFEALSAIGGELAMLVHTYGAMHHGFGELHRQHDIHDGCKSVGHGAHKIGAGEHSVAQTGLVGAIFHARFLNDVAHFHILRTRHFATLAI